MKYMINRIWYGFFHIISHINTSTHIRPSSKLSGWYWCLGVDMRYDMKKPIWYSICIVGIYQRNSENFVYLAVIAIMYDQANKESNMIAKCTMRVEPILNNTRNNALRLQTSANRGKNDGWLYMSLHNDNKLFIKEYHTKHLTENVKS